MISAPFWNNKKKIGKFKFEILDIGEIGASAPKSNSILSIDKNGKAKTKITAKGVYSCCIDDDNPKHKKELEKLEGGCCVMPDRTLIRHEDMIDCVLNGKIGKPITAYTIDALDDHRMVTKRHHKDYAFSIYDDKRYLLEDDYHSLAYGHYKATELIPMPVGSRAGGQRP